MAFSSDWDMRVHPASVPIPEIPGTALSLSNSVRTWIITNFANMNAETSPRGAYDGGVLDTTGDRVVREKEEAGCYVLSVAFNGRDKGRLLDLRLIANTDAWHGPAQRRLQQGD